MGQVWSSADFDGTFEAGTHGGCGSVLAVTAQNSSLPTPLNRLPIDVSIDTSTDASCNSPADRVRGFHSMHSGGAQFLLGDGSVRFVSESVDQDTYRGLSTIGGAELLGEF